MEETLIKKNQFDPGKIIKKYWPYLIGGAILILLLSVILFKFAITEKDHPSASAFNVTSTQITTSTNNLVGRLLDGVLVESGQADLLPYAVMVEMHTDARPLSGIAQANLVYEAPVEGGITRLMVVFDATTTVDSVGPVRSARPYFVEWADSINAVYAHVGGSPEALNRIQGLSDFKNLDEFSQGKYFWRSKQRTAPHNTYTSSQQLSKAVEAHEWSSGKFKTWAYEVADLQISKGDYRKISIPYGGAYSLQWEYDDENDIYIRYQGGKIFKDSNGDMITTKNVVVILTEQRVLDDVGRLYVRTTGSGRAMLFSHGNKDDIGWGRSPGEHIRLETSDGADVPLARGTTWIEVITDVDFMPTTKVSSND